MTGGPVGKGPPTPSWELKGIREARKAVKSRTPLKPVNKERQAKKADAEGFDPDYIAWIRTQPCIVTGLRTGDRFKAFSMRRARVEAAHMVAGRTKGTDMTALPVECSYHREQHQVGIKSWAKTYKLDIPVQIASHRKRYALECAEKARQKEGKV